MMIMENNGLDMRNPNENKSDMLPKDGIQNCVKLPRTSSQDGQANLVCNVDSKEERIDKETERDCDSEKGKIKGKRNNKENVEKYKGGRSWKRIVQAMGRRKALTTIDDYGMIVDIPVQSKTRVRRE
ncbi:hypothetical protein ACH5RR_004410 [Cinchona calisaya]|uniref:Uncharacterized protein n=1 Tax=Cinchona calisaya TaxID=153742 RepID=A0ABD3AXI3_9GENT